MSALEQEIIAKLLYKPEEIHLITLSEKWFYESKDREIVKWLIQNNGKKIDVVETAQEILLQNPNTFVSESYLEDMQTEGFMIGDLKPKIKLLHYVYQKELVSKASGRFADVPSQENLMKMKDRLRELEKLDEPEDDGSLVKTVEEIARQLEEGSGEGILTYPMIDDTLGGGMHGGVLITIGARPAVGKTAYGINLACQAIAKQKDIVIDFFTLEMSKEQMFKRFLSRMTEINSYKLRNPKLQLTEEEKGQILARSMEILETNLRIHDSSFNVKQIEKQIRRRQYESGGKPYLAIVDYLGLIDSGNSQQPRHVQVGEITRTFKILTNELDIPIVLLSQLNRGIESRQDKKPNLADLRESGSIEQDSNVVMFLYRDEEEDKVILDVAKNREGFTGEIKYRFFKSKMYFQEEQS